MVKSHLGFVLDNLWIKSSIKDREKVKFIITGFSMEEELDEDDMLQNIQVQLTEAQEDNENNMKDLSDEIQGIRVEIEHLSQRL